MTTTIKCETGGETMHLTSARVLAGSPCRGLLRVQSHKASAQAKSGAADSPGSGSQAVFPHHPEKPLKVVEKNGELKVQANRISDLGRFFDQGLGRNVTLETKCMPTASKSSAAQCSSKFSMPRALYAFKCCLFGEMRMRPSSVVVLVLER